MLPDSEFIKISTPVLAKIALQDGYAELAAELAKRTEKTVLAAWSEDSIEVK